MLKTGDISLINYWSTNKEILYEEDEYPVSILAMIWSEVLIRTYNDSTWAGMIPIWVFGE